MAEKKERKPRETKPAETPQQQERRLVNLAVDLAEKQIREGTVSPSTLNIYLKMASSREYLEREILESQKTLINAKADSIKTEKQNGQLAKEAIEAMKSYGPSK